MYAKIMAIVIAAALVAGCNTVQGIGKDVERGGEKLQNAAEKAKN
jgi:entericidin B